MRVFYSLLQADGQAFVRRALRLVAVREGRFNADMGSFTLVIAGARYRVGCDGVPGAGVLGQEGPRHAQGAMEVVEFPFAFFADVLLWCACLCGQRALVAFESVGARWP